ncbi:hypothetical protein FHR75_002740 [Kineococcus radiotolerans]|uniref:DUF4190 domain-containing protein n=1 Tax=Kineococcus radiotolerans TaxID=131568 RepID=A0A7W4TN11_KINRA|nr:hypothetical protein [Kineococcus radiotolerans]MBB2901925.1 hypothetical protein [Kineococcus radiotolerans]
MSDSGQGGAGRSWWEKPDQEPTPQDPYRATSGDRAGQDADDPYRLPPVDPGTAVPPTEHLPQPGQPHHGSSPQGSSPYGSSPQGSSQGSSPYGPPSSGSPSYGPPQPSWPDPRSGYPGLPNQQYPGPAGYGHEQQPPVAGAAHAVLWTAVGGLALSLLSLGALGWIASIVALALVPGARREILEARGAKRGLGFLLAGKICAWVNIGLTVLLVLLVVVAVGVLGAGGWFDSPSAYDSNGLDTGFGA